MAAPPEEARMSVVTVPPVTLTSRVVDVDVVWKAVLLLPP